MNKLLVLLLEITIYSGIIFGMIMLFKKAFNKKISPILQYALWFIFIARLLLPVTIDSSIKLIRIPEVPETAVIETIPQQKESAQLQQSKYTTDPLGENMLVQNTAEKPNLRQVKADEGAGRQRADKIKLTWQRWLLLVLIAGAGVNAVILAVAGRKLRKRIRNSTQDTPAEMQVLLDRWKGEMGVTAKLKVILVKGIQSPALTVSLCPQIIIPKQMADRMDEKELYFALSHELMHYKRKDHLLCMVLQGLQVVYWFNPVVWLAFRQVRMDIESACDAMVVNKMKPQIKAEYAKVIIKLSADQGIQYMLGMALGASAKAVEKRIRGIYMINKSKLRIKAVAGMMVLLLAVCCFTTACQPVAGSNKAAAEKNTAIVEQEVKQPQPLNVSKKAETPVLSVADWSDSFYTDDNEVLINVNAEVEKTDVMAVPILRTAPHFFTDEEVEQVVWSLYGDKKLYEGWALTDADKAHYEEVLQVCRQELESLVNNGTYPDGEIYEGTIISDIDEEIKYVQSRIDELEGWLADFEKEPSEAAEIKLVKNQETGSHQVTLWSDENLLEQFWADVNTDYPSAYIQYGVGDYHYSLESTLNPLASSEQLDIGISRKEAEKKALEVAGDCGIEGGIIMAAEKGEANGEPCYEFIISRNVVGIPILNLDNYYPNTPILTDEMEYRDPWGQEKIIVSVGADGIVGFRWENPAEVIEVVDKLAAIKPYSQIQVIAKEQLQKLMSVEEGESLHESQKTVNINRVVFSIMNVQDKESDECLYLPVWDFLGNYRDTETTSLEDLVQSSNLSFLTINAIDGSVVSSGRGY